MMKWVLDTPLQLIEKFDIKPLSAKILVPDLLFFKKPL